jgi:hypothetical protein
MPSAVQPSGSKKLPPIQNSQPLKEGSQSSLPFQAQDLDVCMSANNQLVQAVQFLLQQSRQNEAKEKEREGPGGERARMEEQMKALMSKVEEQKAGFEKKMEEEKSKN